MHTNTITELLSKNRDFFQSGQSRNVSFRKKQLKVLRQMLVENEKEISRALYRDMGKPEFEAYSMEIAVCINEIKYAINKLDGWARPAKKRSPIVIYPSSGVVIPEPLGVVLVIAPWNFPIQLLICPLIAAMAAGNIVVVKPSELAAETSSLMAGLFKKYFSEDYIRVVEGVGETIISAMMQGFRFDHIFFTGGSRVGKVIASQAAKELIPVTLELGGKSPAIVAPSADLKVSANRIIWGKYTNAGQACVAPDYVLVHKSLKDELVKEMKKSIGQFFGNKPMNSPDYGRIINENRFDKILEYLSQGNILFGGEHNREKLKISPTLIDGVSFSDSVMKEEIFGPVLPILDYSEKLEIYEIIERNPFPLALYLFCDDKNLEKEVLEKIPFGGGCINNTLVHLSDPELPFGGVGMSGYGSYHGKAGFDRFSHYKSIIKTGTWLDLKFKYAPFNLLKLSIVKKIFR